MTGEDATFDEELFQDGLLLSLIGMSVVFAVLSLLAVAIKVFDRIDQLVPAVDTATAPAISPSQTQERVAVTSPAKPAGDSGQGDAETAAAIAFALAIADSERSRSVSASPAVSGRPAGNSWLSTGRFREMSNRMTGRSNRNRNNR